MAAARTSRPGAAPGDPALCHGRAAPVHQRGGAGLPRGGGGHHRLWCRFEPAHL